MRVRPSAGQLGAHAARSDVLVIIHNRLRCRFTRFHLCGHFLQARVQRINLLLLAGDCGLLLLYSGLLVLDFAMLFEELIEQHRVDRFVVFLLNASTLALRSIRVRFVSCQS